MESVSHNRQDSTMGFSRVPVYFISGPIYCISARHITEIIQEQAIFFDKKSCKC